MKELIDQLTALRLHGMAACANDLLTKSKPPSLPVIIKLLTEAEKEERRVRSIQYQMRIAKFPHHKDFATFDYDAAAVTSEQIDPFCEGRCQWRPKILQLWRPDFPQLAGRLMAGFDDVCAWVRVCRNGGRA